MRYYLLMLIFVISMLTSCSSIVRPTVTVVSTVDAPTIAPVVVSPVVVAPVILEPALLTTYTERDLECLATNAYREARGEGDVGMAAVAYVTLNRTRTKGFPTTICGVVYHKTKVKGRTFCQFSWACHTPAVINWSTYPRAREIARRVLEGSIPNPVGNSLFFHERSYRPGFAQKHNYVATIGNHRFYTAP